MKRNKIIWLPITLLFFYGCSDKKLIYKKGKYPTKECRDELSNGDHFQENKKIDKIVVSKKKREMYLYREGDIVNTFRISLGKNPKGDKIKKGDHKTPLGSYRITRKRCHSKYYRMIYISYPNSEDISRAKERGYSAGGGITIHAQPFWNGNGDGDEYTLSRDWTNGCIAITNRSMDILWYALKKNTPIVIKP